MFFYRAVKRLSKCGCDAGYSSPAVDDAYQELESVIHELAHAVVLGMRLDRDPKPSPLGKYSVDCLTQQIGKRLTHMRHVDQDRNEEIALAVGMLVLESLGIKYYFREFVNGVDWKVSDRNHDQRIRDALLRPATRKHARRIVNYLHHIDRLPPLGLRPTQA